jgi:predicted amidohydrolase
MIVAGLQMDIRWEDPSENFRIVEEMGQEALDSGARLLVLPEMFATGFSMNAEKLVGFTSETLDFLSSLAARMSVFVLGGYVEPAAPLPVNVCSLFGPTGTELLRFRKLHPFAMADENQHYQAGDSMETVDVEGVRVTPLICYDLRFPEPFRPVAIETDLYCVLANWPDPRRDAWSTLLRARAIENQAYVLGVNRVGEGSGKSHSGDSVLVDPMGQVVAQATPYEQGVFMGDVSPKEVAAVRRKLPFLPDRRPGLYAKLEQKAGHPLS